MNKQTMILRNSIGIETPFGYKLIELYEGDITNSDLFADLLIVSSYARNYIPTKGSLIGSLYNTYKIELNDKVIEYDLRKPLSIWISSELPINNYRRVLCVELVGSDFNLEGALSNIFAGIGILEAKGFAPKTIVMPLLGAGQQYFDPKIIASILIPEVKKALERLVTLEKIIFMDLDIHKVDAIDEAINDYLGRSDIRLPKDELIANLKSDICSMLDKSFPTMSSVHISLYEDMRRLLTLDDVRSFEVGILARRYVESIVFSILSPDSHVRNLAAGIDLTAQYNVAPWIRSYMHTLRLIGNESAHEKKKEGQLPQFVEEDDLVITLFCVHRLLDFWTENYTKPSSI